MSKPTNQKSSFLQTALIMTTIFLGFQIFNSRNSTPDTGTYLDSLAAMRKDNAEVKESAIVTERAKFETRLKDALAKKKIDKAQYDDLARESWILVGDTQFKAGVLEAKRGNAGASLAKLQQAHASLFGLNRDLRGKPEGTVQQYKVAQLADPAALTYPDAKGVEQPWPSSWTVQQLYEASSSRLATQYKHTLVWGLVPGYNLIDFLVRLTGSQPAFSYAFAAFLLAFCVRAVIYPLTQKQLMWGRQMQQLTPLLTEIKAEYKDNPTLQQQKMMELYKEYGINPLSGCLPAVVQFPLFMMVYQCMQQYQFQFQQGTFLWINPAASAATHGFLAPNLGQIDYVMIVIYGISMIVSTLLMPVSDPTQVKQQRLMGVGMSLMFTVFMFFGAVPVAGGFVLYWTFTNILATAQSLRAYKLLPAPPLVKVNAPGGGVYPKKGGAGTSFWDRLQEEARKKAEMQMNDKLNGNGKSNGSSNGPSNGSSNGSVNGKSNGSTGTPAKHKPKKRK